MTDIATCPWDSLLPELRARIASSLPPNEVACVFRLINKLTAREFNGWISVRLSQPVPHHAFLRRWGDERRFYGLTFKQRQQLLCLTSRSGVIANLEAGMGCGWTDQVLNAAAEAGNLVACVWLLDRACPLDAEKAICCAARGGHAAVVRWLLEQSPWLAGEALMVAAGAGQRALCEELMAAAGPMGIRVAVSAAAEGGHVELTEWLLGLLVEPSDALDGLLLHGAALGFELPVLQRLYHSRLGSKAPAEFMAAYGADLAAKALASPTPDWRAKLGWLEAVGCRFLQKDASVYLEDSDFYVITKRGDAVERVALLRERGLLITQSFFRLAVVNSNLSVVRYLRSEGLLTSALGGSAMSTAMVVGDVAILAELLAAGCRIEPDDVHMAAHCGHLHMLHWMAGPEAEPAAAAALQEALQKAVLAEWGARSGSLELMEWLWERGCPSNDERVFTAAANAGNMELLERLAARGCPTSCEAYLEAGHNGDLATLRCLRRLDCPWGPDGDTFDQAVYDADLSVSCSMEVLRWLVAEGCPVDWKSAWEQAWRGEVAAEFSAWLES